jgi:hypothetical protein
MRYFLDLIAIPTDEKLNGASPIVRGKFMLLSGILFVVLWPLAGALSAFASAPSIAFLIMFLRELFFSKAALSDPRHWFMRSLAFVLTILLIVPVSGLLGGFVPPHELSDPKSLGLVGMMYVFGGPSLEWAGFGVRSLRRPQLKGML